jgi:hypothetical protein
MSRNFLSFEPSIDPSLLSCRDDFEFVIETLTTFSPNSSDSGVADASKIARPLDSNRDRV